MPSHVAWGSIGLLANVISTLELRRAEGVPLPVVRYRAKIKLHGSNCAVQVTGGGVFAQSRSMMLEVTADLHGFAAWVRANAGYFAKLDRELVVFGEWCGPEVQRGMAISRVKDRQFAVFAVRQGERVIFEPAEIRRLVPAAGAPPGLQVLPWEGEAFELDFASRAALERSAAEISRRVEVVEREDPWVQRTFGVTGVGEGLVLYPISVDGAPAPDTSEALTGLMFKAKGEKYRTVGARAAVLVEPAKAASVDEFVALMVTVPRLEQGVATVCRGAFGAGKVSKFVAWISADVRKESVAELAASGLTWPQVEKPVQERARAWFLARQSS